MVVARSCQSVDNKEKLIITGKIGGKVNVDLDFAEDKGKRRIIKDVLGRSHFPQQ